MFAVLRKLRSNEAIRGINWGKIPFDPNNLSYCSKSKIKECEV
jgi:hypothetical protein